MMFHTLYELNNKLGDDLAVIRKLRELSWKAFMVLNVNYELMRPSGAHSVQARPVMEITRKFYDSWSTL